MAELSEEQLLLLSNLMYSSKATEPGVSVRQIVDDILEGDYGHLSGSFESNPNMMRDIAQAISEDPVLCSLTVADSIDNKNAVSASCFKDQNGGATIAIRGTGGSYKAWSDNVQGAFENNTDCQETLREFVHNQKNKYSTVTITGHSKGGNMAQYATILEGDVIDRCVSFDGQGFNNDFCNTYTDEIAKNKGKIKSISANNDYVNTLLTTVAGTVVYLDNDASGFAGHSSYYLWKTNKNSQINGQYSHIVEQDLLMKELDLVADRLVEHVNALPDWLEGRMVNMMGSLLGMFFAVRTSQVEPGDVWDLFLSNGEFNALLLIPGVKEMLYLWIRGVLQDLKQYVYSDEFQVDMQKKQDSEGIHHTYFNGKTYFNIDCKNLAVSMSDIRQIAAELVTVQNELENIRNNMQIGGLSGIVIRNKLRTMILHMQRLETETKGLGEQGLNCIKLYEDCENKIVNSVG